jgi:hypothetical protein
MPGLILPSFCAFSANTSPYARIVSQPNSWDLSSIVEVASRGFGSQARNAGGIEEDAPRGLHFRKLEPYNMSIETADMRCRKNFEFHASSCQACSSVRDGLMRSLHPS